MRHAGLGSQHGAARLVAVLRALAITALLAATARIARADDDAPKASLATESLAQGWARSGFRLGLGLLYGELHGLRGAPSGRLLGAELHVGLRLDARWSVYASFEYASASRAGGLSGLRFAGTIDPTWHITPELALAAGLGFGGIVEGRTGRADVAPLGATLDTSYTFPGSTHPLPSCNGVGIAALARATYAHVLGPRASTMVELELVGQDTACVEDTGHLEPDTARPIVRRQAWSHAGVSLLWGVTWR